MEIKQGQVFRVDMMVVDIRGHGIQWLLSNIQLAHQSNVLILHLGQ
jgi:hypothetical protein